MFQFGRRYMVSLGRLHLLRCPIADPQIAKQQLHPPNPLKTMTWQSVALSLILQRYSTICSLYIICSRLGRGLFCVCVFVCLYLPDGRFAMVWVVCMCVCVCECVCLPDWRFACCSLVGRGLCECVCLPDRWFAIVQSGRQGVLCMWMCVSLWLVICHSAVW